MKMRIFPVIAALFLGALAHPGTVISKWDIESTARVTGEPAAVSKPDFDSSGWHHASTSRCTLMGCLINAGVYNDSDIFYSDKITKFDTSQFSVPWFYRGQFALERAQGDHYVLQTHGITSRADVFVNGKQIADKNLQAGSYGGHTYDISNVVADSNALAFKVYPTSYMNDLAVGFVDWNPPPPDNGTGVWRDVAIKRVGSVTLDALRVATTFTKPVGEGSATVALKAAIRNLENKTVTVEAEGEIFYKDTAGNAKKSLTLEPQATGEVSVEIPVDNPALWWPKQWGEQPLYTGNLTVSVDGSISDWETRQFGIRQIKHEVNSFQDSLFSINGRPFQVLGAGYSSDIFLRWDRDNFETQAKYMLDMGLNTVRLEGKMEHPDLYEITDRLGLMVMAGWECCDKWEAWSYNDNLAKPIPVWSKNDYETANASMRHEAGVLQSHPSVLAFLVGSDFWPNEQASEIYVNALKALDWETAIIASAAKKDHPKNLPEASMKMDGPYDWVPPNYWYDAEPAEERVGSSFGFGSEQGPGVGTPELNSLKRFLSEADLEDLWKNLDKKLIHMSPPSSDFSSRTIYNGGLRNRYGTPTSLDDYLMKAQIMDYESTRAEYEGFSAFWNAKRPATGVIYWMLNGAWPNLHWALYDYYLHPAGAYFGLKAGSRLEHVAYNYVDKSAYLINHSLDKSGSRKVAVEVIDLDGKVVSNKTVEAATEPNKSKKIADLSPLLEKVSDVVFLKVVLTDGDDKVLSRNVYWVAKTIDTLDWDNSEWYYTPVTKYADFTALNKLEKANVSVTATAADQGWKVSVENEASVPAFFVSLNLVDGSGQDVAPVFWSDNYVTLWPGEKLELQATANGGKAAAIVVKGKNVEGAKVNLS